VLAQHGSCIHAGNGSAAWIGFEGIVTGWNIQLIEKNSEEKEKE
jgi:hypothetical protein